MIFRESFLDVGELGLHGADEFTVILRKALHFIEFYLYKIENELRSDLLLANSRLSE